MEILLTPNWNPQVFTVIDGTFNPYQLGVPGPDNFWFVSSKSFDVNDILIIKQGSSESRCIVEQSYELFGVWQIIVRRIQGTPNLGPIDQISIPAVENSFYLDGQIDFALNIRIFDLKELKRSSAFTKSIDIPFTPNNDKIFTQIFNVNVVDGFNPKKKSDCRITDGGVLVSSGYLQVQEIDIPNKIYKCVFYGDNRNLFDDIEEHFIVGNSDATFDIKTDWLFTNKKKSTIESAWNNNEDFNWGIVFDDEKTWTLSDLKGVTVVVPGVGTITIGGVGLNQWIPFVRVKSLFDKIFERWGYQYESEFLNTTRFADLFLLNKIASLKVVSPAKDYLTSQLIYTQTNPGTTYSVPDRRETTIRLFTQRRDDFGGYYNTTTNRFRVPYTGKFEYIVTLSFDLDQYMLSPGTWSPDPKKFTIGSFESIADVEASRDLAYIGAKIYRKGILYKKLILNTFESAWRQGGKLPDGTPWYEYYPIGLNKQNDLSDYAFDGLLEGLEKDDEIEFFVYIRYGYNIQMFPGYGNLFNYTHIVKGTYNLWKSSSGADIGKRPTVQQLYNFSGTTTLSTENFIALLSPESDTRLELYLNNYKQVDFIGDIFKMFNLYIKPDKNTPKKFIIEPRDDFYKKGKVIKDLEYDYDSISISYLIDLASKEYTFTYTKGNDFKNSDYSSSNNGRIFGDLLVQIDNDFIKDERKIQTTSAITFQTGNLDVSGTASNLLLPDLRGAKNGDRPRFFYYNGLIDTNYVFRYQMFTQSIAELSLPSSTYTYSVIPMFSQYQQYLQNTSSSLLWDDQSIATKPQSLYYEFYENEIETYADPKSHIMKVKVRMNSNIYSRIDFNDIYYFEVNGNPQYYILLSIDNFRPDMDDLVDMTFLSYYDYEGKKPKRDRFVGGDKPTEKPGNEFPKGLLQQGPIEIDEKVTIGGLGASKGVIAMGSNNVVVGNNRNIISMGTDVIIDYGTENVLVFGGGTVTASNIIAFGSSGATLSTPNTFNFGTINPVLSENTPADTIEGMIIRNGDHLEVYSNGTFSNIAGKTEQLTEETTGETTFNASNTYEYFLTATASYAGTYLVTANINVILGTTGSTNPIFTLVVETDGSDGPEKISTAIAGSNFYISLSEVVTANAGDLIKIKGKSTQIPMKLQADSTLNIVKII